MAIVVPNVASSITANGCIPNSENRWVWIGFRTPITASGSCVWYATSTCTSGCEIMGIAACPGKTLMFGPYNFTNGVSVTSISGGSALVAMKAGVG